MLTGPVADRVLEHLDAVSVEIAGVALDLVKRRVRTPTYSGASFTACSPGGERSRRAMMSANCPMPLYEQMAQTVYSMDEPEFAAKLRRMCRPD
jgi:hypothetical protein